MFATLFVVVPMFCTIVRLREGSFGYGVEDKEEGEEGEEVTTSYLHTSL
jgi:hypothetical protein